MTFSINSAVFRFSPGKQHTYVETDSVRYVYQPLERMYVLLITTKASNILEDLETLRLFARVVSCSVFYSNGQIPEYARGSNVSDVVENAFQIIFAFDEIVALGYRESVTLSQIRTFTEMDSHEEKMFNAAREVSMPSALYVVQLFCNSVVINCFFPELISLRNPLQPYGLNRVALAVVHKSSFFEFQMQIYPSFQTDQAVVVVVF